MNAQERSEQNGTHPASNDARQDERASTRRRRQLYRNLKRLARPYWKHLGGTLMLALLSVPVMLALPWPLKIAVDSAINNHPLPHWLAVILPAAADGSRSAHLEVAMGLLIAIVIAANLQTLGSWLLQTFIGERLVLDLRSQLFWHAQRMNLAAYERRGAAELAYRIQFDAPAVQSIFLQGVVPLAIAAMTFIAMLAVTARIDWQIAAVAVALTPFLLLIARRTGVQVRSRFEDVKKLDSAAMLVMQEALAGVQTVKAFGQEAMEHNKFHIRSRERMGEQLKLAGMQASSYLLVATITGLGSAAAMYLGVRHVVSGVITVGELLVVIAYMAQVYEPLKTISSKLPELQSWMVSTARAFALLEDQAESDGGKDGNLQVRGDVEFRGVCFRYRPERWAVQDVSFHITPGTRVGIVGASGSGKTTMMNLLTRFYEVNEGAILLDGRDLRTYSIPTLRRQIAILPQEPVLFSATLAENIAYGRPQASRAEVIAAAMASGAHQFIEQLPDGYDTNVGEGGWRLSGGQRQRVAIARAFLKDSPVLILDEPTSALDIRSEREIVAATDTLMRGRTTFIIAHRLNTLSNCDIMLLLKEGRLEAITTDLNMVLAAFGEAGEMLGR